MKTWIVSSLDEETIQGRKPYEEIRYVIANEPTFFIFYCPNEKNNYFLCSIVSKSHTMKEFEINMQKNDFSTFILIKKSRNFVPLAKNSTTLLTLVYTMISI